MAPIDVERFEVVRDKDNLDVAVFFMGRARILEDAPARIVGPDLLVDREGRPPLVFAGLIEPEIAWLRNAPSVYVNRTFEGVDEMRRVHLVS